MSAYAVRYTASAARQLRKLDRASQMRIARTVEILADNPRPPAATKLVGGAGAWRVRTGDHRIVYEILEQELVVLVVQVGHRREVYGRVH
ncbi:MAG: type II toxin-antitoxin system RelE/ParE family toxin [Salinibacterium sp.]|nr:MAG: type II toxin-antitoxin system RelE/ParE family toxin [Salinibacterium sp.]